MTQTGFADMATLMSPRTAKYVEAMVREGFDYNEWLKEIQEQEAEAKQAPAAINPRNVVAARVDKPITSGSRHVTLSLGAALVSKAAVNLRVLRRPHRQAKSKTPKARLRRWLEKVHRASGESQGSREYLAAVFAIVMHYKVRRRTTRLLRHAFKFADRPFHTNADAFTATIRCTCGNAVDPKAISKWARALRYVARSKRPATDLREFMKRAGGINGALLDTLKRTAALARKGRSPDPVSLLQSGGVHIRPHMTQSGHPRASFRHTLPHN